MRSTLAMVAVCALVLIPQGPVSAQRPEGGPPRGVGGMPPILRALDADADGVISAEEIEHAAAALKRLDTNEDGKLTMEELRPQGPGPEGRDGPPRDRGGLNRGPRDGDAGERGPRDGDRGRFRGPPEGGDRPRGPRDADREEGGRGPRDSDRLDSEGPGREGPGREGPGGFGRQGRGGPGAGPFRGGFGGPPPEALVARAMEFDADDDGKLDREELGRFAESMARRIGGFGRGEGGGFGFRGPGGPPRGEGRPAEGRPERPRRPSPENN